MPANDGRHHRITHRARVGTLSACAAAIIVLALGACSSTTTTSTAAGASGGPGTLTGAGSTYVAPFFALAFARYHQQHPSVTVNYSPVGSSAGIAAISGYSWALIYTRQPSPATGQTLVTMLDWLTHDGQAYAAANLYVPLPAQVRQLAHTILGQVTGPQGTHFLG